MVRTMKHVTRYSLLVVFLSSLVTLDVPEVNAQQSRTYLTTRVGIIRNVRTDNLGPHYSIYPEVQISRLILEKGDRPVGLEASVNVGGWRAGSDDIIIYNNCWTSNCNDIETQAHNSLHFGARLHIIVEEGAFDLSYVVGFSEQFIWFSRAFDRDSEYNKTRFDPLSALETGVRIQVPISQRLKIGATVLRFWKVFGSEYDAKNRYAYALSLSYRRP